MFAIAFDLDVKDTLRHHPDNVPQAYADIRATLKQHDFEWKQGSVYVSGSENLAGLFAAIQALKGLPWFP